MKNKMLMILMIMIENGYYLFNETPEQFVDRMIGYGFGIAFMESSCKRFLKYKENEKA